MKIAWRASTLATALLVSVLAAYAVSGQREPDRQESAAGEPGKRAVPPARDAGSRRGERDGRTLALERLRRDAQVVGGQDPFRATTWERPAAPLPRPTVAARPGVPPLPFTYLGRLDEVDGQWIIYLARGAQSYLVGRGEILDSTYRIENIEGDKLIIRYLPLNAQQILTIGDAS